MPDQTVTGVVLKRQESGETSRRLIVFSRELGKIDVIAKGARKGGSRLAGISEPLILASIHFAAGKQRRFVTQAQPQTSFPRLREDYDRLMAGLAFLELTDAIVPWETPAPEEFDHLCATLRHLDDGGNIEACTIWALTKWLELEGILPKWRTCADTGAHIDTARVLYSPIEGGSVVENRREAHTGLIAVSDAAMIALERIVELPGPPANIKAAQECLNVLAATWRATLDRQLPALTNLIQGLA